MSTNINNTDILNKLNEFLDTTPSNISYYNDKNNKFERVNWCQSKHLFEQYNIEMKSGKVNSYLCFNDKKILLGNFQYYENVPIIPRYIYLLVITTKTPNITGSLILNTEIYGDVYYFLEEYTRDKAFNNLYF